MAPPSVRKGDEVLIPKSPKSKAAVASEQPVGAAYYLSLLFIIYLATGGLAWYRNHFTPTIVPEAGPNNLFSEGRALAYTKALTDYGVRFAGTHELEASAEYLLEEGQKLADYATQHRPDLLVQVFRERYSGAVAMDFINKEFINMYNNITNVILVVSPKAALTSKSVLVNAHFDSALSAVGASDDASCVGIMLEIARLLIEDESRSIASPIVFLMNGAEEAACPASHAFMQQSPWAKNTGVFLNLESTGNQGPFILFQQTGDWPIQSFVRSAPHPRGSVVAQDIFQLGLIPADTDYRFFSANIQGSLPGLDIASLLGAGAYHTDRDIVENIRPGTVQAMGENALAFVVEVGKDLALREQKGTSELDSQHNVFFDVLGMFMVTYPFKVARLVHSAPLALTLSIPFIQRDAFPGMRVTSLYAKILLEAFLSLLSFVAPIFCGIFMGVFRVTLFSSPMSWHGNPYLAYTFLVPASAAGTLLPYLGRKIEPRIAALGHSVALGIFSAVTAHFGLGMGFITTIWAIAGLFALSDLKSPPRGMLKLATLHAVFPIIVFLPNTLNLSLYILQKANMLGARGQPDLSPLVADGVAGAVVGLSTVAVLGYLPPWFAYAAGRNGLRRTVLSLFMVAAMFATIVTFRGAQYTVDAPKKVVVQQIHRQLSGQSFDSTFAVGSIDSVPVSFLLDDKRIQASRAAVKNDEDEVIEEEPAFKSTEGLYVDAMKTGWEWLATYPLDEEFVESVVLQDDGRHKAAEIPSLSLLKQSTRSDGSKRFLLQLNLPWNHAWIGTFNVTGQIQSWSLPSLKKQVQQGTVESRYVRFIGNGAAKDWQFWIDVMDHSSLSVQVAAAHNEHNPSIARLVSDWPKWAFPIHLTTYTSEHEYQ